MIGLWKWLWGILRNSMIKGTGGMVFSSKIMWGYRMMFPLLRENHSFCVYPKPPLPESKSFWRYSECKTHFQKPERVVTPLDGEEALQKSHFIMWLPGRSTRSVKNFSIVKPGNGNATLSCLFLMLSNCLMNNIIHCLSNVRAYAFCRA